MYIFAESGAPQNNREVLKSASLWCVSTVFPAEVVNAEDTMVCSFDLGRKTNPAGSLRRGEPAETMRHCMSTSTQEARANTAWMSSFMIFVEIGTPQTSKPMVGSTLKVLNEIDSAF